MPTRKPPTLRLVKATAQRRKRVAISQLTGLVLARTKFGSAAYQADLSFDDRILRIKKRSHSIDDYIIPGFIDLQVNGGCGIDVMSASVDDLLELSHCLAHEGTTGWLPTVITSPLETIERIDGLIAAAMAAQAETDHAAQRGSRNLAGATILGMHLEGPFISPERRGVHPPFNLLPQGAALERVSQLKTLKLITLAPELDGALEAIRILTTNGVVVSIGHTDATYEQTLAGIEAGARMFTHLFNSMPPLHHRTPGAVGAALSMPAARAAIIPDGVHLHPALFDTPNLNPVITTDRVALASTAGGPMALFGGLIKEARTADGAARLPDGTLAGSVITMLDGLHLTAQRLLAKGWSLNGVLAEYGEMSAFGPSAILGLDNRGRIESGWRADLIVLDRDLNLKAVFVGGRELD
ncbi:MAG TPA: amidohydrolase family protein [Candidatus Binataceae bacterium]|nr:amidohydrolase family protein [Candidatus Binataceae bacterium]